MLLVCSAAVFMVAVVLITPTVHFVVSIVEPGMWDSPLLQSRLSYYYNLVFRIALAVSGVLFLLAVEPWIRQRLSRGRVVSAIASAALLPVYFGLLFACVSALNRFS